MKKMLIKDATIVNEGVSKKGSVLIENDRISKVIYGDVSAEELKLDYIDAEGLLLFPGVIDDQVHFREPGLTHKGELATETKAAVAGGVTSFMEMPNTNPQTTTIEALEAKYALAAEKSLANYSFYMGATNDNLEEILKIDPKNVCGIKIFMGSSTGNMLVDKDETLRNIFSKAKLLIATHCEDEETIVKNLAKYREKYGEDVPMRCHGEIRSAEACYKSSKKAADLARETGAKLHILHLSTEMEMGLLDNHLPLAEKRITGEVCVHHLWFTDEDYDTYGSRIKWNPSIKKRSDRDALHKALIEGKLDVVATDHAPHTLEEKANSYFKAPSGGPLVQHSLVGMLEMVKQGIFTYEMVVEKMCHAPAILFQVEERGYIREGYKADLVLVNPKTSWKVEPSNIHYKCGWSPFDGLKFSHMVVSTFVNGKLVYNHGNFDKSVRGERLTFKR